MMVNDVTDGGNDDTGSKNNTDADFEAILGQLNSLDHLFDSVATETSSTASTTTKPTAPPPAGHQARSTAPNSDFDGCDDVLRGALLELNAIANSPTVDGPSGSDAPLTSLRQNGHTDRRRPSCGTVEDTTSSSSSSSLSTVASDKSSSMRNGSSSPASSSVPPSLKPAQVFTIAFHISSTIY